MTSWHVASGADFPLRSASARPRRDAQHPTKVQWMVQAPSENSSDWNVGIAVVVSASTTNQRETPSYRVKAALGRLYGNPPWERRYVDEARSRNGSQQR